MIFEIRNAKNGLILKARYTEKEEGSDEIVFQEKYDDEDADIECFADFLRLLSDNCGPTTSRYSPKRIYIRIEPGDKYDGPNGK